MKSGVLNIIHCTRQAVVIKFDLYAYFKNTKTFLKQRTIEKLLYATLSNLLIL